jgi:hypothetical protein
VENGGGADGAQKARVIHSVVGEHRNRHVRFREVVLGKERPAGTVDQTSREGRHVWRLRFPFEKPAGDAPGGVKLFVKIDGKREEVLAFFSRPSGTNRHENRRLTIPNQNRSVRLSGELSGL